MWLPFRDLSDTLRTSRRSQKQKGCRKTSQLIDQLPILTPKISHNSSTTIRYGPPTCQEPLHTCKRGPSLYSRLPENLSAYNEFQVYTTSPGKSIKHATTPLPCVNVSLYIARTPARAIKAYCCNARADRKISKASSYLRKR